MKKGFTLIELLAAVVILSILAILIIPAIGNIISSAADKAYELNIKAIESAASDWALLNTNLLPDVDGNSTLVYLDELKRTTTLDTNISNPKTGNILSNNTSVTITKNGKKYKYKVNLIEITGTNDPDAPRIVIAGNIIDYVEVSQTGSIYNIPSAEVRSASGSTLTNARLSYQIIEDNKDVSYVDTSKISKYRLIYSATHNDLTGVYEKTVIVRDTTIPSITFDNDLECSLDELSSIDLLDGVTVTDNSGEVITPTYEDNIINQKGTYNIYYSATDSSGNTNTLSRARLLVVR